MENMLKEILNMDKQAREKVKELEQYRLDAITSLNDKKEKIVEEENQKALNYAKNQSDKSKKTGEKYLAQVRERNKKLIHSMNELYNNNSDKWAEDIFNEVISD